MDRRLLLGLGMAFLLAGGQWALAGEGAVSDGTQRMVARLRHIAEESNPLVNPFMNREAVAVLRRRLDEVLAHETGAASPAREAGLRFRLAVERLHAGENDEAIREFRRLRRLLSEKGLRLDTKKNTEFLIDVAVSYLRLGEQENCQEHHTAQSCLFPIRDGGIHRFQRGSRGAIEVLTQYLFQRRNDLRAAWLLNLAYMTLGEYPDKVPPLWLIPPGAFRSEYALARFPDVAARVGLDVNGLAGGVILDDFDNDDDLDLMLSSWGLRDPLRYFRNEGDGSFRERDQEAGLAGLWGGLNMVQADYNNDGFVDVLVLRGAWFGSQGHHPNSLLRNNGDGTFSDVTEEAGLLSFHPTQTATWFDFNHDGWLDLYIGNETTPGEVHACELFRSRRDGTFTECAAACGVAVEAYVKSVASGDFDNDGWPDLYVGTRGQSNHLFRNVATVTPEGASGARRFEDVTELAGVAAPRHTFPSWFFDFDNDGWLDIFACGYGIKDVGNIAGDYLGLPTAGERPRLYRNLGNGRFRDVTRAVGLHRILFAMSGNFGDLDNDGFLDIYLGTGEPELSTIVPNRMLRNAAGQRFQDVTTAGGFGHLQKGHGIAFGDIDHDGDEDVYEVLGGAYAGDFFRNALFENPGNGNRWIKLKLVGSRSNRSGIGARIRITVQTPGGDRTIYKTVRSGGSFGGSPLRQEIGLGNATRIREIEVFWPASGRRQGFEAVPLDRYYRVQEAEDALTPIPLRRIPLGKRAAQAPRGRDFKG